ncbi:hypothetical protein FNBNMHLP_01419 [Aeromonas jandaei]
MLSKPVLTIAIPTYNRLDKISEQVRLILPQLDEQVKLIVYDNCSKPSVAGCFSTDELMKFTIVRNRVNVGADANIARTFENCETKWLWTLSDDDLIKPDALKTVLDALKDNTERAFICFAGSSTNVLPFETTCFNSLASYFKSKTVYSACFTMSCCIYNISILNKNLLYYYDNLSSMVGTLILVIKSMQENSHASFYYSNLCVIDRFNDDVGWNYEKFIYRSVMFTYVFGGRENVCEQNRLFLGHYNLNYYLISLNRKSSKLSRSKRLKLFWFAIKYQGILNAIKYSRMDVFRTFISVLSDYHFTGAVIEFVRRIREKK